MTKPKMDVNTALVSLLPLILLASNLCECSMVIPDQLHCASEIHHKNERSGNFDWFLVDEFVDRTNERSSMRLLDFRNGMTNIYFNELSLNENPDSGRKFITYNTKNGSCSTTSLYNWPLYRLRRTIIQMLPIERLTRKMCDIALGPSTLLTAIEATMSNFRYLTTEFSKSRLTNVDIFERLVYNSYDATKPLLFTLRILSQGRNELKANKTLANFEGHIDVLSLIICQVDHNAMRRRKDLNQDYECDSQTELMIHVDYYLITDILTGSLLGRALDRTNTDEFDFHRDPFLQPIGIGCWHGNLGYDSEKRFSASGRQFSAEYHTTEGTKGLSYVAFDGYRRVLRLDREGRKSVFDLNTGYSYHMGEFSSIQELNSNSKERSNTKSCVVLETSDKTLKNSIMVERLLGIGLIGQSPAYYLGIRTIDHVSYSVYEMELVYDQLVGLQGYNLPILIEPTHFVMPQYSVTSTKRYFITYYVIEYTDFFLQQQNSTAGPQSQNNNKDGDPSLVPKFMELWEMVTNDPSQRSLLNRLEFTEFSWSLEVEPSGDPDSQDLSRLFNIETCIEERAKQLQLRYRITQDPESAQYVESKKLVSTFRSSPQVLKEVLHEKLASALEISRLNIAHLDVTFSSQNPRNLLVESQIVELRSAILDNKMLGYAQFSEIMRLLKNSILAMFLNRHSLDSCRLDSLSSQEKSSLVFCAGMATCILLKEEALGKELNSQTLDLNPKASVWLEYSPLPSEAVCEVHKFSWALKPTNPEESIIRRVEENRFKLAGSKFEMRFIYMAPKKQAEIIKYIGLTQEPEIKILDSVGLKLANSLAGLRYMLANEESSGGKLVRSMNTRSIKLASHVKDPFVYCQMACQLDEYCESFSICLRAHTKRKDRFLSVKSTDCILSTMVLTGERMAHIAGLISEQKNRSDDLELSVPSFYALQLFWLRHDLECNLHPKDTLSTYRITGSLEVAPTQNRTQTQTQTQTSNKETTTNDDDTSNSLEQADTLWARTPKVLSLDTCAQMSHEAGLWIQESNFTYCPMGSICVLAGDKIDASTAKNRFCYLYSKYHSQFYNIQPLARLSVQVSAAAADPNSISSTTTTTKDGKRIQEPGDIETNTIEEDRLTLERLKIGRWFEGLNVEQCARDCNLRQANCLAFDSCKLTHNTSLCVHYSIRSPLLKIGKKLGLLPQEQQFYNLTAAAEAANNNNNSMAPKTSSVRLVGAPSCEHFTLKGAYADIRLQQMLDELNPSKIGQKLDNIGEIESVILTEDKKIGDVVLDGMIEEAKKRIEINSEISSSWRRKNNLKGQGYYFFYLLIGLLIGCLGTVYSKQVLLYTMDIWEANRAKWGQRHAGHRISQLALANNVDL